MSATSCDNGKPMEVTARSTARYVSGRQGALVAARMELRSQDGALMDFFVRAQMGMAVKKPQAQATFSNILDRRPLSWIYRRWAYLYSDDPALD
jgi:hypothetical protein